MEDKGMFKFDINMNVFGEKYDENGKFWFEDLVSRKDKIAYIDKYNCNRMQALIELGDKFLADKASLVKLDGSFKVTVLAKWLKENDNNGVIKDKSPDKLTYCLYEGYMQGSLLDYPNIKSASHWSVYDNVDVVDAHFNNRLWVHYVDEHLLRGAKDDFHFAHGLHNSLLVIGISPYTSSLMTLKKCCRDVCVYDSVNHTEVKVLSKEDIHNLNVMLEPAKSLNSKIKEFKNTSILKSLEGATAAKIAAGLDNEIQLLDMESELERMIAHAYRDFGKSIGLL